MAPHQLTRERIQAIEEILSRDDAIGVPQLITDIVDQLQKAGDDTITPRIVRDYLSTGQIESPLGMKLERDSKSAWLVTVEELTIDVRATQHPDVKKDLGHCLWHVLLGVDLVSGSVTAPDTVPVAIKRKLDRIRRKSTTTLLIDAGSTTAYAIDALLELKSMPIRVSDSGRLMTPFVVTNSLTIAAKLARSRYRRHVGVRLVGGDVRIERDSICGMATQICLDAWKLNGDVSITGTTGYRPNHQGVPAFGCDGLEESRLKSSFHDMALLRVLLFDASKLLEENVSQIFASVHHSVIDMVVTDSGKNTEEQEKVRKFQDIAAEADVAVFVLER